MTKLIRAFNTSPTRDSAKRLLAYLDKHPMAICLASESDEAAIKTARKILAN